MTDAGGLSAWAQVAVGLTLAVGGALLGGAARWVRVRGQVAADVAGLGQRMTNMDQAVIRLASEGRDEARRLATAADQESARHRHRMDELDKKQELYRMELRQELREMEGSIVPRGELDIHLQQIPEIRRVVMDLHSEVLRALQVVRGPVSPPPGGTR